MFDLMNTMNIPKGRNCLPLTREVARHSRVEGREKPPNKAVFNYPSVAFGDSSPDKGSRCSFKYIMNIYSLENTVNAYPRILFDLVQEHFKGFDMLVE